MKGEFLMLKFIIVIVTIILITLCININPNMIETKQEYVISENDTTLNEISEKEISSNEYSKSIDNKDDISNNQEQLIFVSKEIPNNIYKKMLGKSIPTEYKDKIDLKTLRYLQISYFGFDEKVHVGEMIVNAKLADEILEIFKELYEIKYPIEKIKLIDDYNSDDNLSMSDNNTSCFCYRVVPGSTKLSNHAKRLRHRYKSSI